MRYIFLFLFGAIFSLTLFVSPTFSQFQFGKPKAESEKSDERPASDSPATPAKKPKVKLATREDPGKNGPRMGRSQTKRWQTGVRLKAVAECNDMLFLIPIPMDWPEQTVVIKEEKASNNYAEISRKDHSSGGLRQMVVKVPKLYPGASTEASLDVEATRFELLPPEPESIAKLSLPQKPSSDLKPYLNPSPQIESNDKVFKDLYKKITEGIESDWGKVEAVYKYVQNTIRYDEANKAKIGNSASETLKLKRGDCKEMTAVFIAICRAGKVPARTVWIPGHCYVEFYMEDDEAKGYWFPCQVAGSYSFGGIPETAPVLQKGDNFTFKEFPKEKYRFVERLVTGTDQGGKDGAGAPKCEFFGDAQ